MICTASSNESSGMKNLAVIKTALDEGFRTILDKTCLSVIFAEMHIVKIAKISLLLQWQRFLQES